jgi:hypothetical protein
VSAFPGPETGRCRGRGRGRGRGLRGLRGRGAELRAGRGGEVGAGGRGFGASVRADADLPSIWLLSGDGWGRRVSERSQGDGGGAGLGASCGRMGPARRQPFVASQVRAGTTGEGVASGVYPAKPSNQGAEEQGSGRKAPGWCFSTLRRDVNDCDAHLLRGGQVASMVAIAPERAAAAEGAIDRPGGADAESLHAPDQAAMVVSLDDEVHVISLHRRSDHPEAVPGRRSDAALHDLEQLRRTQ